jgi:hypothetical protein
MRYFIDNSEHILDACSKSEEEALESSGEEDEDEYVPHKRVAEEPLAGSVVRQPNMSKCQALQ